MDRSLWEKKEIDRDRIYRLQAAERIVFAGSVSGEWRIATSLQRGRSVLDGWEEIEGDPGGKAAGLDWTRTVAPGSHHFLRAAPSMPDKPLVIRPESSIFLPEGKEGLFFVEIPLWLRITGTGKADGSDEIILAELPTRELSKTWFGNLSAGELCYISRTRFLSGVRDDHLGTGAPEPGGRGASMYADSEASEAAQTTAARTTAICPVTVKNFSTSLLEFERVCIRTEFLSIFEGDNRLWTSAVELVHQGHEEASQTTGSGPPRQLTGEGRLLAPGRAVPDNSIVRKSFSLLKDLTGW